MIGNNRRLYICMNKNIKYPNFHETDADFYLEN